MCAQPIVGTSNKPQTAQVPIRCTLRGKGDSHCLQMQGRVLSDPGATARMTGRSRLAASPPPGTPVAGFQVVVLTVVLLYRHRADTPRQVVRRRDKNAPDHAPAMGLAALLPELVDVVRVLDGATRSVRELFHLGRRLIKFLQPIRKAARVTRPPAVLVELPLDNVVLRKLRITGERFNHSRLRHRWLRDGGLRQERLCCRRGRCHPLPL